MQKLMPLKESKLFSFSMLLFPIVFLYFEIVFALSTSGNIFKLSTIYVLLFSIAYGGIAYLLTTIFKKKLVNYIITVSLLVLGAVPYLIEYFVNKFFKIFYDINTIVGGAGGVMGEFTGEFFGLIFSFDGIFKLILFFLPAILYVLVVKQVIPPRQSTAIKRSIVAAAVAFCYFLSIVLISFNRVYAPMFSKEYNFQNAVANFGLSTSIGLDLKNFVFGKEEVGFEKTEGGTVSTWNEAENKEYGYNEMKLEFKSTSNSDIKQLNEYVEGLTASRQNKYTGLFKGKNLIMISAEAFSAEVIDKKLTPTLYRLATKGINFTDYYQPSSAGTTGGEYQNIFGMLPTMGGKSFKYTANNYNYFTMGSQLDRLGYYGKAFHNNSHTYYDRHITHNNLGYSDGFMAQGNGMEAFVKNCWPQSDLEMFKGTLPTYIDKEKFNVYYMSVSGHSGYTTVGNSMTKKNWDKVKDLSYSDTVKGYFAANLELEYAMEYLVKELEKKGIADDTVICISSDHFPYGLDANGTLGNMPYLSELYGFNVTNAIERDHSRLILWSGCLEDQKPIMVNTPTTSLDILPTLSNLFGTEFDSRLFVGRDVFSDAEAIAFNSGYDWKTELGTYYSSKGKFVPKDDTVEVPDDYVERIKTIVRNKINFCTKALENDYYGYLFE